VKKGNVSMPTYFGVDTSLPHEEAMLHLKRTSSIEAVLQNYCTIELQQNRLFPKANRTVGILSTTQQEALTGMQHIGNKKRYA
jgi:hypothetical protein